MNGTGCISTIKHRIEAIGAAYMVLAGMLSALWIAARPGDGSLACDASRCRLLGFWSKVPEKIGRGLIIFGPLVTLGNIKFDNIR